VWVLLKLCGREANEDVLTPGHDVQEHVLCKYFFRDAGCPARSADDVVTSTGCKATSADGTVAPRRRLPGSLRRLRATSADRTATW